MWILRFHLIQSKDYNKITRICKRYNFISRHHSAIIYAKAVVKHTTQGTSWRALKREFGVDHIALYKFYENAKKSGLLGEIFHIFGESGFALYVGDMKTINIHTLDNSKEIIHLTKKEFTSMLQGL